MKLIVLQNNKSDKMNVIASVSEAIQRQSANIPDCFTCFRWVRNDGMLD